MHLSFFVLGGGVDDGGGDGVCWGSECGECCVGSGLEKCKQL